MIKIDVEECTYIIDKVRERKYKRYTIHTEKGSYVYSDNRKLGKGASGDVYKAEFANLENHLEAFKAGKSETVCLALKIIEYEEGEFDHEQIKDEIETLQSVNSDCIISFSLYDWGYTSTHYYLFIELSWLGNLIGFSNRNTNSENKTVCKRCNSQGNKTKCNHVQKLPLLELKIIAIQIAEGLFALHKKGIIHQDIKPGNIFMDYGREHTIFGIIARLGDLGSAIHFSVGRQSQGDSQNKASDDNNEPVSSKKTRALAGTPAYMAPEVESCKEYGRNADIYSLGALFHELHYGNLPNKVENFVRPTETNSTNSITDELNELLEGMLVIDPGKRFDIFQVLASPFLQPGYWQLLLWRIELGNIVTFGLSIEELIRKYEFIMKRYETDSLPVISNELMATAVHSICVWGFAFKKEKRPRIVELLYKTKQETVEKVIEQKFVSLMNEMKMSSEFSTIIGFIREENEDKENSLYNYRQMTPIQEKLFNLLFDARTEMLKQNNKNGKFLHSILFGRVLEICYSEECFQTLLEGQNDIVVAIDWGNSRIGFKNELELAQKREAFLSKYFEELLRSPGSITELHIFFHEDQRIAEFLYKQKFNLSERNYFGNSMIVAKIGNEDSSNSKIEISILIKEQLKNWPATNSDEIEITYLKFRKFSE